MSICGSKKVMLSAIEPVSKRSGHGEDLGSNGQLEAVKGGEHFDLGAAPADRLEPHRIGEDDLEHPVVEDRIVMEQCEAFDLCCLRQLDRNNVAGVAPMLLDRQRVTERVHCIEDQQIGVPVELDKWIGLVEAIIFVLAIGRIDDGLGSLGKAIRIRITRVKLLHRSHRKTGDLANLAGFEGHELDRRGERAKIYGKPRSRVLGAQRLFERLVAAEDANSVPRNVSGGEKREPHDVIPMGMWQEDVEAVLAPAAMLPQNAIAELPYTSA